ncbi:hypothetical protein BDF19DRAFT_110392 [Syncephalis fuscata]|nr:hypothetical protein BDF19DRAFT_110392 [Syncephalis fuscata]
MKSILAIATTALMLVSITQVTPVNGIPGLFGSEPSNAMPGSFNSKPEPEPRPIEFMSYKNNDSESPFTIYDIQFTDNPYEVKGVHYIKGTQHNQPITLTCGSDPNPNNNAFQVYEDLKAHSLLFNSNKFSVAVPKGGFIISGQIRCYVLPGQCEQTYKQFAENPLSAMQLDMKKILDLWRNIGSGLDAIRKVGWYATRILMVSIAFINNAYIDCIARYLHTKKKDGKYMPQFFNFNTPISTEWGFENGKAEAERFVLNEVTSRKILWLVPKKVKIEILCKLKNNEDAKKGKAIHRPGWTQSELYRLDVSRCLEIADEVTMDALEGMLLTNNPNWHSHQ